MPPVSFLSGTSTVGAALHVLDVRTIVLDKLPIILSAAVLATHCHGASPEYDEIARICD
jgi:hypothetical protein